LTLESDDTRTKLITVAKDMYVVYSSLNVSKPYLDQSKTKKIQLDDKKKLI